MSEMAENDELGKRLLAEKHRAEKDFTRQWWQTLFASASLYVFLQLVHVGQQTFEAWSTIITVRNPSVKPPDMTWVPSAGIDPGVASTIVLGVAAFVVTINVAVFAARLSSPQDEASALDLARWQRRMQGLAPNACYVALAVTFTQIPSQTAMGLSLLLISALAVAASDLRIAGRLSALRMDVRSTERFSSYANEQYEVLLRSLTPPVQRRVADKNRGWNAANLVSLFVVIALVSLATPAIMVVWFSDPSNLSGHVRQDFSNNLLTSVVLCFTLFMTVGGAALTMVYAAAGKLVRDAGIPPTVSGIAGVGGSARWGQWALVSIAVILHGAMSVLFGMGLTSTLLTVGVVLLCCACQHLLIRLAVKTGLGPGMAAAWLALANRAEDKRLALKQFEEAKSAHQEAEELLKALAVAADLEATTVQAPVSADSATANTGPRREGLRLLQRILAAVPAK